jgi:ABC-2 type transport system ATP-binding protein
MQAILELENVTGGYSVGKPVLHGISFSMRPGEMVGLIGLNGAGKSTTLKHILGLLTPHEGSIRVGGVTLQEDPGTYRSSYAYVPESPLLYDELNVSEHLRLTAMAYGVGSEAFEERTKRLYKAFQMEDKQRAMPGHLSKGMRQKVMIMNAFLSEPPLYLIDEPFLGLDPLGIRSLLERMVEMKRAGAGILMSSHILSTLEAYCDRYIVLHRGRVRAQGELRAIAEVAGLPNGRLEEVFFRLVQEEGSS